MSLPYKGARHDAGRHHIKGFEMEDILVPLGLFFAPVVLILGLILVPKWLRSRERLQAQQLIRMAIERGQEPSPELIEALTKDIQPAKVPSASRDMRIGVILLSVAAGIALTGVALGQINDNAMFGTVSGAAIPGMIGLAFIILSFFNPNKRLPQD